MAKVELAYKAVKDEIRRRRRRTADGAGWHGRCGIIWRGSSARIRSCCRRGWPEVRRERAQRTADCRQRIGGHGKDPAGDERGRYENECGRRLREWRRRRCGECKEVSGQDRSQKRRTNGSNYINKCGDRDCQAGGGGCAAGSDGEPGDGEPGQSRLRAGAGADGRHDQRADSADAGGEQHRGRRNGSDAESESGQRADRARTRTRKRRSRFRT